MLIQASLTPLMGFVGRLRVTELTAQPTSFPASKRAVKSIAKVWRLLADYDPVSDGSFWNKLISAKSDLHRLCGRLQHPSCRRRSVRLGSDGVAGYSIPSVVPRIWRVSQVRALSPRVPPCRDAACSGSPGWRAEMVRQRRNASDSWLSRGFQHSAWRSLKQGG